jgi:hypothetical protein
MPMRRSGDFFNEENKAAFQAKLQTRLHPARTLQTKLRERWTRPPFEKSKTVAIRVV